MDQFEVNERGYFWWSDTRIPNGHFAPPDGAFGLLTITDRGVIRLDLDSVLSEDRFAALRVGVEISRRIVGQLNGNSGNVLLQKLWLNGGSFNLGGGGSSEKYIAEICFVGRIDISLIQSDMSFDKISIPMDGFEELFGPGSLSFTHDDLYINILQTHEYDFEFPYRGGTFSVRTNVRSPYLSQKYSRKIEIEEKIYVSFERRYNNAEEIIEEYHNLEDILILFSNRNRRICWPQIFADETTHVTAYFSRKESGDEDISLYNVWVNLWRIRNDLGMIFEKWQSSIDKCGPGIFLYIGTRRNSELYLENKFMNMMWGMEALHRKIVGPKANQNLKDKISRILSGIESRKDFKWLERILLKTAEPDLKERIYELVESLSLPIKRKNLSEFSKKCADYRNDISHFGTSRCHGRHQDFTTELIKVAAAVDILCHLKILLEIGLSGEGIVRIFENAQVKQILWVAGLLDEDPSLADRKATAEAHKEFLKERESSG